MNNILPLPQSGHIYVAPFALTSPGSKVAVETKTEEKAGFGIKSTPYITSKRCVNALTTVLAGEHGHEGLLINACCPGWVDTDMGKMIGEKPVKTCGTFCFTAKSHLLLE